MMEIIARILFAIIAMAIAVFSSGAFMFSVMKGDYFGVALATAASIAALICGYMIREKMDAWLLARSTERLSDSAGSRIEAHVTDSDFSEWEWELRSKRTE